MPFFPSYSIMLRQLLIMLYIQATPYAYTDRFTASPSFSFHKKSCKHANQPFYQPDSLKKCKLISLTNKNFIQCKA